MVGVESEVGRWLVIFASDFGQIVGFVKNCERNPMFMLNRRTAKWSLQAAERSEAHRRPYVNPTILFAWPETMPT